MSGAQRAAVLLIALGVEAASNILSRLSDDDVEAVSVEIARLQNVSSDQVEAVLTEYNDLTMAQRYVSQGGAQFARQMLEAALGPERADDVMMKVEAAMEVSAFHMLQTVDIMPLLDFLENEHPQTVALILTQLNTRKASDLINHLPPEVQREVVYRIAKMAAPLPNVLREVEEVIRQYIGAGLGTETGTRGGVERVADILSASSRTTERSVMEALRERDPELASTIKGLMFVFDDLVHLDDRALQKILMQVEQRDLALALKAAPDPLQEKVLRNVSERVAAAVREEIELLGSVAVSEVDDAQARVLEAAAALEERGEVTLTRSQVEKI
jgi:flagellar motor switch protein FliG